MNSVLHWQKVGFFALFHFCTFFPLTSSACPSLTVTNVKLVKGLCERKSYAEMQPQVVIFDLLYFYLKGAQ